MNKWEGDLYELTHYALAAEYILLTCVASFVLSCLARHQKLYPYKSLFFVLIILGSVGRAMGFLLFTLMYNETILLSNSYAYFASLVPALLFFTAYCILLFQWMIMLFTIRAVTTNKGDPEKIKRGFVVAFLVFTCLQYSVMMILCFCSLEVSGVQAPARVPFAANVYEQVLSLLISVCYTLASLFFLACGILLIKEFRTNLLIQSDQQSRVRWRMIFIVILVPLTFFVRVFFVAADTLINLSEVWWMDWVYFTFFEWLPLLALVTLSGRSGNDPLRSARG